MRPLPQRLFRNSCLRTCKQETEQVYRIRQEADSRRAQLLLELKGKPNITRDGHEIRICANIGGTDGADAALANDAGGIGLFRSEFLYLEHSDCPTEAQQFDAYREVLTRMEDRPVIIRTLDIGADKRRGFRTVTMWRSVL